MISNPNYQTKTLLAPFEAGPVVQTFLRDTFFAGREFPPTNLVEFDFRRGRRKMAPFIAPIIGGKVMEREGFETRFFKAPRIAPIRNLRIPDLEPRMFGETIYSGRTPADRAADLLAEDAIYCDEAITRREEWMCREVLVNGALTITADHGYQLNIDFMESSAGPVDNHETPANGTWDNPTTSTPLEDLETARLNTIAASGIAPNVALFGSAAKQAFIDNVSVQKMLDNRRYELGMVAPVIVSDSVVKFATVPGLECYSYAEYFEDDAGVLFPMLPENLVMLLSTNVQNKIVYGAFTQLEDAKAGRYVTYQVARIPFVYGDEVNGQLFYRLTSCPLPMPNDVLGWRIIDALPGTLVRGGEPLGDEPDEDHLKGRNTDGVPYFAPTGETFNEKSAPESAAQIKEALGQDKPFVGNPPRRRTDKEEDNGEALEAHTVEELRAIADSEGVSVPADARKGDIIKAIEKARKGR
jgi:Phage major capsid protein E